ncbi:hypothetical protein GCM10010912_29640 [Paenibacillus albidus]|uniref:Uncharacterized protein n=1 Tax=Paenibacillus albidus TaxID=2041023 RepID=A0A917FJ44_9BACL|nr:hypothetical protein [Paenibacillus albidus]GGF82602.1 hypothetical protein GCM10010912_29640 [Paenibacillus albidus]
MADIVQPLLLDNLIRGLSGYITGARVKIDGEQVDFPIQKTVISGLSVRKYIYITETQAVGQQLFEASLLDQYGNALAVQPLTVIKNDKGFLIAFEFVLRLEASSGGI